MKLKSVISYILENNLLSYVGVVGAGFATWWSAIYYRKLNKRQKVTQVSSEVYLDYEKVIDSNTQRVEMLREKIDHMYLMLEETQTKYYASTLQQLEMKFIIESLLSIIPPPQISTNLQLKIDKIIVKPDIGNSSDA